jgi:hypothetical protein
MPVLTAGRFAAATSVLALAVAMGGTGYAAVKIGGNQIKSNAITSKKIKDNSVTGADVNESTLAKVPSAATADSATTAGKANGMTPSKIAFHGTTGPAVVVYNGGGLVITAGCPATNDLQLIAATTKNDSSIYSSFNDVENDTVLGNDDESQGFDVGDAYDLLAGDTSGTQDPALLTFVYDAPDGSVVTGSLATDNSDGGGDVCSVTGTILAG